MAGPLFGPTAESPPSTGPLGGEQKVAAVGVDSLQRIGKDREARSVDADRFTEIDYDVAVARTQTAVRSNGRAKIPMITRRRLSPSKASPLMR